MTSVPRPTLRFRPKEFENSRPVPHVSHCCSCSRVGASFRAGKRLGLSARSSCGAG